MIFQNVFSDAWHTLTTAPAGLALSAFIMVVCKWSEIFCAPQKGCFDAILMTSLLNLRNVFFTQATIAATIAVHLELNLEGRPLPSFRSTVPRSFRRSAIPCTVLLEQDSFFSNILVRTVQLEEGFYALSALLESTRRALGRHGVL